MWGLLVVSATLAATLVPAGPVGLAPEGCTIPVSAGLDPCPRDRGGPPRSCVLPVGLPPGTLVGPECPRPDREPERRIVPLLPATR